MQKLIYCCAFSFSLLFVSCNHESEKAEKKEITFCDCLGLQVKIMKELKESGENTPFKLQELEKKYSEERKECHLLLESMTQEQKEKEIKTCDH